jgi:hypothetical protein
MEREDKKRERGPRDDERAQPYDEEGPGRDETEARAFSAAHNPKREDRDNTIHRGNDEMRSKAPLPGQEGNAGKVKERGAHG